MNLLSNILIQPNVISQKGIEEILGYVKSSSKEDLSVFDPEKTNKTGETSWIVDKKVRDTQVTPINPILPGIEELFNYAVHKHINPYYNELYPFDFKIWDSEVPQLLSYGIGGHYNPHIDGEGLWTTPTQEKIWRKTVDRDLSIVLYLNDDFEGGDFIFPDLRIRVRPEPGLMICFPSNRFYRHGVEPVTRGERHSIVTWCRVQNFETMEEQSQKIKQTYGVC